MGCEGKHKMVVNVLVPEGTEVEYEEVVGICQPVMYLTIVAVEEETPETPETPPEGEQPTGTPTGTQESAVEPGEEAGSCQ